jgi:hypothetical protein
MTSMSARTLNVTRAAQGLCKLLSLVRSVAAVTSKGSRQRGTRARQVHGADVRVHNVRMHADLSLSQISRPVTLSATREECPWAGAAVTPTSSWSAETPESSGLLGRHSRELSHSCSRRAAPSFSLGLSQGIIIMKRAIREMTATCQ